MSVRRLDYWRSAPGEFIEQCLIDHETGRPFVLLPAQKLFLAYLFMTDENGRLLYPTLVYSAIKKSGKTTFGAMIVIVVMVLFAPPFGEAYILANDFAQAQSRVFEVCRQIIGASPLLRDEVKVTSDRIVFKATNCFIRVLASDFGSAAGGHPTIAVIDEMWNFTTERASRLWAEMVPVPTRKFSARLVVSHAGFLGESELFEGLYRRGLTLPLVGPDLYAGDGMLMHWSHTPVSPEHAAWVEQMRRDSTPVQFLRQCENRFAASERAFIDMKQWDACCDPGLHMESYNKALPVTIGVDASTKRDATGIATVTWEGPANRVRVVRHRIFQPTPQEPLDFQDTIEAEILDLAKRFAVQRVYFDPHQMVAVAQRLKKQGIPIEEYTQTVPNLTAASQNLFDLVNSRRLAMYPSPEIRLAASRAIAVETARGWRIAKELQSHKIDIVVALAMACLAAVKTQSTYLGGYGGDNTFIRDLSKWV